jgi:hypothetical protein
VLRIIRLFSIFVLVVGYSLLLCDATGTFSSPAHILRLLGILQLVFDYRLFFWDVTSSPTLVIRLFDVLRLAGGYSLFLGDVADTVGNPTVVLWLFGMLRLVFDFRLFLSDVGFSSPVQLERLVDVLGLGSGYPLFLCDVAGITSSSTLNIWLFDVLGLGSESPCPLLLCDATGTFSSPL